MYFLVFGFALCVVATDIVQGALTRLPEGITLHKRSATWDEARDQCRREGGVVASPINEKALNAMKTVITAYNTWYFIGTTATGFNGEFISIEGVALEDMPEAVTVDMVHPLNKHEGDCLAMNGDTILAVPCWREYPYMCYNTHIFNMTGAIRTYCGPDEEGYKYDALTGHCYKLHKVDKTWEQAYWTCFDEGGHLAIIENEVEAQSIQAMDDYNRDPHIFIGRRKLNGNLGWRSIFGQPVEELYNIVVGTRSATDSDFKCGGLHQSGKWQYVRCWADIHFICQKEPTF